MATPASPAPTPDTSGRLQSVTSGNLKWTDIKDPTAAETDLLGKEYGFHPLDLEDCLSGKVTKVEDHGDHIFLLLHFPEKDDQDLIAPNRVTVFVGRDYLVTCHTSGLGAISLLFESCSADEQKRASMMKSSPFLAYSVLDVLMDAVFSILDDVQGDLDAIEAVVFDETKSQAGPINHARRKIASLSQILTPLKLYIPDFSKSQKFAKEDLSIYFSDLNHRVRLASGTVDEMKELLEIYKDTDYVTSSNRTNNVLSILTILFTLTIPATLLSSIYGMNIPLPGGAVTGPTGFAGIYTSAIFLVVIMVIPALIMVWYFRRAGWF